MAAERQADTAGTPGRFVTFEGGEGAGKTTQLPALAEGLRRLGQEVVTTREPGGTPGADAIRALLVQGAVERWSVRSELLLMTAARVDHVERVVEPALARGAIVLCDRYVDSTRVYQGVAGGLGLETVDRLQFELLGLRRPDLTLLLDLPAEEGLRRRRAAGDAGRFEAKGEAFHAAVRDGFRQLARLEPERIHAVDAARPAERVAAEILDLVTSRFGLGR